MAAKWSTSDAVQDRILDATLTVMRERGYADSTMSEIVALSGVSTGSIYHHFGGKEELYAACFERLRQHTRHEAGIDPDEMPDHGLWEADYLAAVRHNWDECYVFLCRDTPPTFDPATAIAEYYGDLNSSIGRILGSLMTEAMRIIGAMASDEDAKAAIDSTVKLLNVVRIVGF